MYARASEHAQLRTVESAEITAYECMYWQGAKSLREIARAGRDGTKYVIGYGSDSFYQPKEKNHS
jgi:hypothetical protein